MKKMVMIAIAVFFVFGCIGPGPGPRFSSEAQSKGYKGIIANRSKYYKIQIVIRHKNNHELGSYVLSPGDFYEEHLPEGDYYYEIIALGHQKKLVGGFTSGPRIFKYFGKDYHWYVYYYD